MHELWFVEHGLAFACWYAGYRESWDAERVVFAGTGPIETYPATEKGGAIATRGILDLYESIASHRAWIAAAHFEIPPLVILGGETMACAKITRASAGQKESGGGGGEQDSQLQKGTAA